MKYHKQLYRHEPERGICGDCFRTCIACILDMVPLQVPHFADGLAEREDGGTIASARVREWLTERGHGYAVVPFDCEVPDLLKTMGHYKNGYWILGAQSKNGVGHCLVCYDGEIIWDPAIDASPEDELSRLDGYVWAEFITVGGVKP